MLESPDHPLVLEHLAELEQSQGDLRAAEAVYRKILARRADPHSGLRLAALLQARGESVEATRLRDASRKAYERAVASGNEGYLRPLAILELGAGRYQNAAELAARDARIRPTAESRMLLESILDAAAAAGLPIDYAVLGQTPEPAVTKQPSIARK